MRVRFRDAGAGDGWRFRGYRGFGVAAPPTLRVGDINDNVADLQEMLNARGYNVPISGSFDAVSTLNAVMDFQAKNGLKPDGIVGPLTWGKLNPTYASAPKPITLPKSPGVVIEKVPGSGFALDPLMIVGGLLVAFAGYKIFFSRSS